VKLERGFLNLNTKQESKNNGRAVGCECAHFLVRLKIKMSQNIGMLHIKITVLKHEQVSENRFHISFSLKLSSNNLPK